MQLKWEKHYKKSDKSFFKKGTKNAVLSKQYSYPVSRRFLGIQMNLQDY
jgi:hypothetical protein